MRLLLQFAVMTILPACDADVIHFKDGSRREGSVTVETEKDLQLAVLMGTLSVQVTIPKDRIARIVRSETKSQKLLRDYQDRLRKMDEGKADEWYALGLWCDSMKILQREAIRAYAVALEIEPQHEGANEKLGNTKHNGRWMTPDKAKYARRSEAYITGALENEPVAEKTPDSVALFEKYYTESLETQRQRAIKAEASVAVERQRRLEAEQRVKELEERVGRLERQLSRSSITIPESRPVIIIRNQPE